MQTEDPEVPEEEEVSSPRERNCRLAAAPSPVAKRKIATDILSQSPPKRNNLEKELSKETLKSITSPKGWKL